MGGKEYEEEQVEDSESDMTLVPERGVCVSKSCIEISREKVLAGRETEMEEMAQCLRRGS